MSAFRRLHDALHRSFLRFEEGVVRIWEGYKPFVVVTTLIFAFVIVLLWPRIFVVLGPGDVGVMFRPFFGGTIVDHVYGEGLHVLWPWNTMYSYNTRVQALPKTITVLTCDGLTVQLDVSIRYHPEIAMIGALHQLVGPEYAERIVVPEVTQVIRTGVGGMTAYELYTGRMGGATTAEERRDICYAQLQLKPVATAEKTYVVPEAPPEPQQTLGAQPAGPASPAAGAQPAPIGPATATTAGTATRVGAIATSGSQSFQPKTVEQIINQSVSSVSKKFVLIDNILIVRTTIPVEIQKAIERKLQEQQNALAQEWRIQTAAREREIRKLEAEANNAVRQSLNGDLLKWKGIEATKELATSPNTKIIVIGSGPSGLPLILGSEK